MDNNSIQTSENFETLTNNETSDYEKHQQFIEFLKKSKLKYNTKKHFGVEYKKHRKRKNKQTKISRRANRK